MLPRFLFIQRIRKFFFCIRGQAARIYFRAEFKRKTVVRRANSAPFCLARDPSGPRAGYHETIRNRFFRMARVPGYA